MNVSQAIDGAHVKDAPWNNLLTLTSSAGQQFLSFAKFTDYGLGEFVSFLLCTILFTLFCAAESLL